MLVVEGDPAMVERFVEDVKGANEAGAELLLDFEQLLPTPPESLKSTEWRDWRREHWGTKWNASDVRFERSSDEGCVHNRFATAWRPPDGWLRGVSAAHLHSTFVWSTSKKCCTSPAAHTYARAYS